MQLSEFAATLADRLGRWQAETATSPVATDTASSRIWDSGPLAYTAFEAADAHRCILTSPHGLQLYVMPRPHRPHQYLVVPMLPAGCSHDHVQGISRPRGIAVPTHPARAAVAVRRRMLLDYRHAAMSACRRASPGRMQVEFTVDLEGRPRVTATYGRALHLLLEQDGFLLDPSTGQCYLPQTLSPEQAAHHTRRSAVRLEKLGFAVIVGAARTLGHGAGGRPGEPAVPPTPPSSPAKPKLPAR